MGLLEKIDSPSAIKELSFKELEVLAEEIRQFLIENVSETGGHLASNLGIVEITIAMHKVFNSPLDSFIFDVGHQSYVHKILTGRRKDFPTLRKFGGLSGFPKKSESEHDKFDSGHASNSISVALGIAEANKLKKRDDFSIAILGDGALTGGMAYEAMNNAGRSKTNLIVILNDNEMSISSNVGSMTKYLNRLRTDEKYTSFKENLKDKLSKSPMGKTFSKMLSTTKSGIKQMLLDSTVFEALGFTYVGPIDGHNIEELCNVLESAKHLKKPVFIHACTKKGKGYTFAEQAPDIYHGISSFDKTKMYVLEDKETYSSVAGDVITGLAADDKSILAISAAMADAAGLAPFKKKFPERFFDVGISEAHAVTFASGLSSSGFFPAVYIYSTFMQRAYDSIVHDLSLQKVSALLCLDRAGLVGADGETHHGIFDIAYLSHIPNMEIFTPYTKEGLTLAITHAAAEKEKVYAVRYPRGQVIATGKNIEDIYEPEKLRDGKAVTVVSISAMTNVLKETEFDGDHFHLNCIKPLRLQQIKESLNKTRKLVTVEDNVLTGGIGTILCAELKKAGFSNFEHLGIGINDSFVTHGSVNELLKKLQMDSENLAIRIKEFCE